MSVRALAMAVAVWCVSAVASAAVHYNEVWNPPEVRHTAKAAKPTKVGKALQAGKTVKAGKARQTAPHALSSRLKGDPLHYKPQRVAAKSASSHHAHVKNAAPRTAMKAGSHRVKVAQASHVHGTRGTHSTSTPAAINTPTARTANTAELPPILH